MVDFKSLKIYLKGKERAYETEFFIAFEFFGR